ncbi:hypothetical protein ACFE04_017322 [Oxalis oulophora]
MISSSSSAVNHHHQPLQPLLDIITNILSLLLLSSLSVNSFVGRWQVLRSKLTVLQSSLSSISDTPHWSQNPLLHTLLPSLLSTLQRLKSLSDQCGLPTFSGGKLHMQSDLDCACGSLSTHINDLDLLIRSGVLHQSSAIVLSQPVPGSVNEEELDFFIRDLFTRLQIGGVEFKKKALESLLKLLEEDEKSISLVVKSGKLGYLVNLLDLNYHHQSVRELAVLVVSFLVSESDESRRIVFEEGGLGPLLRVMETSSMILKEKAAIAIEAITADVDNAWAVAAYGGLTVLLDACRSGSQATQTHAVGAIRNIANVDDIKLGLVEEGAIPVLLQLLVSESTTIAAKEKSASCIAILASSGDSFRESILQERGLHRLMHLVQGLSIMSSSDAMTHALIAISSLLVSDSVSRVVSSSTTFIVQLGEFIKHGSIILQQVSASLLGNLSISDGNKRAIASCMGSLIKLMESPKPAGLQEAAMQALVSLLTVRSNRKEFVRDEKSVMRLVLMLDPKNEIVSKKFPLAVATSVLSGGSNGCRKRLMAAGAHQHLQTLSEMDIAGAKKALQRLQGNRLKRIITRTWRE